MSDNALGKLLIVFALIGVILLAWLVDSLAYYSRGCAGGYQNYFTVEEREREDGVEFSVLLLNKFAVNVDYFEVSAFIFQCKLKGGKTKRFDFSVDYLSKDGKPVPFNYGEEKKILIKTKDLYAYMAQNGIDGTIKSIKLINVDFTAYSTKSNDYSVDEYFFVPTYSSEVIGR